MKYKRLRIANYRGVETATIEFKLCGLTLVQGPNEAGKTSLGEAIGILFEFPDSSKHSIIKAIRPVHRDAGPEIELDAESGPFQFTYSKRFSKKPATKLTITAPKPENHTGREAHDRATEILAESLDIDLWKALTIQQGDAIHQPDLTKQQSLSAALDKAAGGVPTDQAEESLFEKIAGEYGRFYTATGKERSELLEAHKRLEQAESTVAQVVEKLQGLDHDIDSVGRLQAELIQLTQRETNLASEVEKQTGALHEIEMLEKQVSEARLKWESASKTAELKNRDKKQRQSLMESVDLADLQYQKLLKSSSESVADSDRAENQFKTTQISFQQADEKKKQAYRLAALRRADFDYYNNLLFLEQLRERRERIDSARKAAAHAEEILDNTKVDPKTLKTIERAERGLLKVNAILETAAPSVTLRGLAPGAIQIGDDRATIANEEVRKLTIANRLRIVIPDRVEIEIAAGSSAEELTQKVVEARRALDAACRAAGVDDPDTARNAFEERREATRKIDEKERIEQDNLRDLSYGDLVEKLLRLEQTVPEYLANRESDPAMVADLGAAKAAREKAEAAGQEAQAEWESAQTAVDAARSVRDQLSQEHESERIELRSLENDRKQQRMRLEAARKIVTDEALEKASQGAEQAVDSEQKKVNQAETALKAKNPDRIKALAETAESSLKTIHRRREAARTERTQVQTRLKIHGEEGLHEKLQVAESSLEAVASDHRSLCRRATAAKRLYDIMRQERDKARQAYVAPLKERVERLGRLVYDGSFQVEIDENLQIINRTSGGMTVPFVSLSGGTKEQLSLIFRLACSMIVASEGGMPLIMDDALGYTDPDRLRLMGAVLAKAAKQCQIVIFTCVPARYGNIGDAAIVSL